MKRIGNSKEPTIQCMLNMTSNLHEKLHESVFLDLQTRSYHNQDPSSTFCFWLSIHNSNTAEIILTWPKLIARYRELMND